jgi:archaellum component FlaG (FlaF/FlaG flagellin family)
VLLAWLAAVLLAAVVAAVLAFDALGRLRRLAAALAEAGQDLTPQVRGLVDRLPGPAAGARAATRDPVEPGPAATGRTAQAAGRRGLDR